MARNSAAKIIVGYHAGEPNEGTSDLAAFEYFNDNSASNPATFADDNQPSRNADTGL